LGKGATKRDGKLGGNQGGSSNKCVFTIVEGKKQIPKPHGLGNL